ncbi:UvrD-helicase domain-containing protein [Ammonicoccus fulvus]|uniref:UvrD-helicase domain-containing protein n=1 Tax=Ammonicoccus fulvus TaxID=3138240 RepID=A0ABZ3FRM8_9ACTN
MTEGTRIEDAVRSVLSTLPCSIALPAGTGKTELIAATVAQVAHAGGSSLVLTHTHAGVDTLRRRMKKFGVRREDVAVRTIDSWSYDLIAHFPELAGLKVTTTPDWSESAQYHLAAALAARSNAVVKMLGLSYTNLFVDEYQDCVAEQHRLIHALSTTVPTTILGDPLQSLLTFGITPPVEWETDVLPHFPAVELSHRPRRWEPDHADLGEWLMNVRDDLMSGSPIRLGSTPVRWVRKVHDRTFVAECKKMLAHEGTIAVMGKFRTDCVKAASMLNGGYSVMEALDEKVTVALAAKIDAGEAASVAFDIVEFAIKCSIGLAAHIPSEKRKRLLEGKSFTTTKEALKSAYEALTRVRDTPTPDAVLRAFHLLGKLSGVRIHCREAWNEVSRSLASAAAEGCTVTEALLQARNRTRATGRAAAARVVSRPLLVKGLEYDHVIILNPTSYSTQELYVALTRGSKSVTVISESSTLPAPVMAQHNKNRKRKL